jgi:hypothetical protein
MNNLTTLLPHGNYKNHIESLTLDGHEEEWFTALTDVNKMVSACRLTLKRLVFSCNGLEEEDEYLDLPRDMLQLTHLDLDGTHVNHIPENVRDLKLAFVCMHLIDKLPPLERLDLIHYQPITLELIPFIAKSLKILVMSSLAPLSGWPSIIDDNKMVVHGTFEVIEYAGITMAYACSCHHSHDTTMANILPMLGRKLRGLRYDLNATDSFTPKLKMQSRSWSKLRKLQLDSVDRVSLNGWHQSFMYQYPNLIQLVLTVPVQEVPAVTIQLSKWPRVIPAIVIHLKDASALLNAPDDEVSEFDFDIDEFRETITKEKSESLSLLVATTPNNNMKYSTRLATTVIYDEYPPASEGVNSDSKRSTSSSSSSHSLSSIDHRNVLGVIFHPLGGELHHRLSEIPHYHRLGHHHQCAIDGIRHLVLKHKSWVQLITDVAPPLEAKIAHCQLIDDKPQLDIDLYKIVQHQRKPSSQCPYSIFKDCTCTLPITQIPSSTKSKS